MVLREFSTIHWWFMLTKTPATYHETPHGLRTGLLIISMIFDYQYPSGLWLDVWNNQLKQCLWMENYWSIN